MVGLRALTIVVIALALGCGTAALPAGAPAPLGAVAEAHPEPGDVDGDTVRDEVDNCPTVPNGSQLNSDGDTQGDACDPDDDNDAVADNADNCRLVANPDQADSTPGDGRGNACPPVDTDGDGHYDDDDNCPLVPNPDLRDLDGDDKGDACDRDDDGDRYDDGYDNCPVIYNPDQGDLDGDRLGSACDAEEPIAGSAPGVAPGPAAGAPGAGTTAAADRSPPQVTVTVGRRQRLADAGPALVVTTSCSEACNLQAVVGANARSARKARLGRASVTLARGSWSLAAAGRTYVFARWTSAARRLRSGRRLTAALRVTAADGSGNRRTVTRRLEMRR
jgi:hypothetical protein